MIAYLLANWKQLAAATLLAAAAGYALHRPEQPAVTAKVDDTATQSGSSAKEIRKEEGPVRVTKIEEDFGSASSGATPGQAVGLSGSPIPIRRVTTVTDRGPVVTDTSARENHANAQEHKLDLTISAPQPGWAVGVGVDGLTDRRLRLSVRRRLFGGLWAEASAVPVTRAVGVGLAIEF